MHRCIRKLYYHYIGNYAIIIYRPDIMACEKLGPDQIIIFSCDQAALRTLLSVCLSLCPSVRYIFLKMSLSSYRYCHWQMWCPCKRSRSEVKGQGHRGHDPFSRFRTVTPVWIHQWLWNDARSLMLLRRGALLFFKVFHQISRSYGTKNLRFWPKLGVSGL